MTPCNWWKGGWTVGEVAGAYDSGSCADDSAGMGVARLEVAVFVVVADTDDWRIESSTSAAAIRKNTGWLSRSALIHI